MGLIDIPFAAAALLLAGLPVSSFSAEYPVPPNGKCAVVRSRGTYSAEEIHSMFKRPDNETQLLLNLRMAMQEDLFLQAGFYQDDNALNFFRGTASKWVTPREYTGGEVSWQELTITVDRHTFPGMTVKLLRSCLWEPGFQKSTGHVIPKVSIDLHFGSAPGFTVSALRRTFGKETEKSLDYGIGTDGGIVAHPPDKGFFDYENVAKERGASTQIRDNVSRFFVKLDSPQAEATPGYRKRLSDNDALLSAHLLDAGR